MSDRARVAGVPAPLQSPPSPNGAASSAGGEPITGIFPATRDWTRHMVNLKLIVPVAISLLSAGVGFKAWVDTTATREAAEKLKPLSERQDAFVVQFTEHIKDEAAVHRAQNASLAEMHDDQWKNFNAMQRVILTRQPQDRLSFPEAKDGGK